MAVEPRNGLGDVRKDDAVGDVLVNLVHIETLVGPTVELLQLLGSGFGHWLTFAHIDVGGQGNGTNGDDDARSGNVPVEVDVISLSVGANEVSERNETSSFSKFSVMWFSF